MSGWHNHRVHSDDVAGSLIDALAGEGDHVDDGGFTLDRAAALAKLRSHQLAEPIEYLLILVEAAWAAEADDKQRSLKVECRSDTYVDFRGPSLDGPALLDLFAAVFAQTSGLADEPLRRARVLQLLGLAVNHALALEIDAVTIDAFDAEEAPVRLRVSPTGELALVDEAPEPKLAPGWIRVQIHSMQGLARGLSERALLTRRCRYASFPVRVDGRLVSKQPLSQLSGRKKITLDGRNVGEAGYRHEAEAQGGAEILVINRGVELPLPDFGMPAGMFAFVSADLPMDLSRSQLVEGPELEQIRDAVRKVRGRLGKPPPVYSSPEDTTDQTVAWLAPLGVVLFLVIGLFVRCAAEENNANQPQPSAPASPGAP